jgi:hypothetical protein
VNWSDNIPECGVLCKTLVSERVGVAMKRDNPDDCSDVDFFGRPTNPRHIIPITAAEWWQFAPWNYDIGSAPINKEQLILVKRHDGAIYRAYWHKMYSCWWSGSIQVMNPIAWLPLPEDWRNFCAAATLIMIHNEPGLFAEF